MKDPERYRIQQELQEEIQFYLEERTRELIAKGMSPEEARAKAEKAFGDVDRIVEEVERVNGRHRLDKGVRKEAVGAWLRDARWALRSMARNPGFTAVALLTLALGLGANTAIYSLVDATLFRAPPVQDPDRLVAVYTTSRRGYPRSSTSFPDFLDYQEEATLLQGLAATATQPASLGGEGSGARFVGVQTVSGSYFELVGVPMAMGRGIGPGDDILLSGAPVVVLSHRIWVDQFGSDGGILGSNIQLNGRSFQVVGVAGAGFKGLTLDFQPDVWIPLQSTPYLYKPGDWDSGRWEARSSRWMGMSVGRMRPGVTVEQVRDQFYQISERLKETWGDERGPRDTTVDPLASYALPNGSEASVSRLVWLLLATVGFTLLLACANLANLLLVRGTSRARDMAVRFALGAERRHVIRHLLMESTMLAVLGGVLGLGLAVGMLKLLGDHQLPGGILISSLGVGLDRPVLLFTLLASVLTGIAFGLVPTLEGSRPDIVTTLKGDSVGHLLRSGTRLRQGLVAIQVALCLVLLVGSALFVQTLRRGLNHDFGFDTHEVALARINLGLVNYDPETALAFADQLQARLMAGPGVEGVSYATRVPLQVGGARGYFVEIPGYDPGPEEELRIDAIGISDGYFQSLGLAVLEGRAMQEQDRTEAVAVINQAMAERYWPGRSAVGRTFFLSNTEFTVIGVSETVTWNGLQDPSTNYVYIPMGLSPDWAAGFLTFAVRARGDGGALLEGIRQEITALDPDVPITLLQTMEDQVHRVLSAQSTGAVLLSGFGALALLLAALGIGGVVAFSVSRQHRDIGIRMALGARQARVLRQIVLGMAAPVLVGLAAGTGGALALARSMESFLFGVSMTDPRIYLSASGALAIVAMVAALIPARRATRVDPADVLKAD